MFILHFFNRFSWKMLNLTNYIIFLLILTSIPYQKKSVSDAYGQNNIFTLKYLKKSALSKIKWLIYDLVSFTHNVYIIFHKILDLKNICFVFLHIIVKTSLALYCLFRLHVLIAISILIYTSNKPYLRVFWWSKPSRIFF